MGPVKYVIFSEMCNRLSSQQLKPSAFQTQRYSWCKHRSTYDLFIPHTGNVEECTKIRTRKWVNCHVVGSLFASMCIPFLTYKKRLYGRNTLVCMWQGWFKALLCMFEAFYVNRGRNSEYRDVRSRKKIEMRFLNILRHRIFFSSFSENTGGETLIFGICREMMCLLKWMRKIQL